MFSVLCPAADESLSLVRSEVYPVKREFFCPAVALLNGSPFFIVGAFSALSQVLYLTV